MDDINAETVVATSDTTPEPLTVPKEVNAGPANIILQSQDGVMFYSHKINLSINCELFNAMFDAATASEDATEKHDNLPVVKVQERAKVLNMFLPFFYNVSIAGNRMDCQLTDHVRCLLQLATPDYSDTPCTDLYGALECAMKVCCSFCRLHDR